MRYSQSTISAKASRFDVLARKTGGMYRQSVFGPAALLLFLIRLYRLILSPAKLFLFGGYSGCRFTPTCSQYAAQAIRRHGALTGGALALRRICRCHPLGGCGHDPVPQAEGMEGQEPEAPLISNG